MILFSDNGGMSAANFGNPNRVVKSDRLDKAFSTSNLPLRGAKGWLYEGGIRVPLIVHWPRRGQRGQVCDVPVISTDFYPTILEMVGLPLRPQQHVDGVSLAPLVSGTGKLDRAAIYWHFPHYSNHGMQSPGGAVRVGDYKLLEYFENNTVQLFNLRNDIGEQTRFVSVRTGRHRPAANDVYLNWTESKNTVFSASTAIGSISTGGFLSCTISGVNKSTSY